MSRKPPPGDLLARIAEQAVDDDYQLVAARRSTDPPRPAGLRRARLAVFAAAVAVLAVMLTVAALQTREDAVQADADRAALIDRIEREQAQLERAQQEVTDLTAEIERLQITSQQTSQEAVALEERLKTLASTTGVEPVSGPGVRITITEAAEGAPATSQIQDSDLQRLANGLWQAGAEAVAINGQRLTSRSAIRTAEQAITVNYRSLSPPYVVTAIGDPSTLPARLLETPAGQHFTDLSSIAGIGFRVDSADALSLPGLSPAILGTLADGTADVEADE
jgi:uncharacterized protein YlxW (UPF0749 family)